MRESREVSSVAYTKFVLFSRDHDSALFCFFEGKADSKYYIVRVKNICSVDKHHSLVCGDKSAVIHAHL